MAIWTVRLAITVSTVIGLAATAVVAQDPFSVEDKRQSARWLLDWYSQIAGFSSLHGHVEIEIMVSSRDENLGPSHQVRFWMAGNKQRIQALSRINDTNPATGRHQANFHLHDLAFDGRHTRTFRVYDPYQSRRVALGDKNWIDQSWFLTRQSDHAEVYWPFWLRPDHISPVRKTDNLDHYVRTAATVEDLGEVKLEGRVCRMVALTFPDDVAEGWGDTGIEHVWWLDLEHNRCPIQVELRRTLQNGIDVLTRFTVVDMHQLPSGVWFPKTYDMRFHDFDRENHENQLRIVTHARHHITMLSVNESFDKETFQPGFLPGVPVRVMDESGATVRGFIVDRDGMEHDVYSSEVVPEERPMRIQRFVREHLGEERFSGTYTLPDYFRDWRPAAANQQAEVAGQSEPVHRFIEQRGKFTLLGWAAFLFLALASLGAVLRARRIPIRSVKSIKRPSTDLP